MAVDGGKALVTAVVVTPETGTAGSFIIMDLLAAVGTLWETLHGDDPRPAFFLPRLVSIDGQPYRDLHGVTIHPHGSFEDFPNPDIVMIPELAIDPWKPLPNSFSAVADWIKSAHQQGALVASLCSGSMLLSETGLLEGEDATSHWGYCDAISSRHPGIRMRKERVLVPAGEGHRLITTGGFASWHDLLLYLVGRLAGPEEARRLAKLFLLDWHADGQLPYAALTVGMRHNDSLVTASQVWVADNYAVPNPVAEMAAQSGLTERSFLRRFKRYGTVAHPVCADPAHRRGQADHRDQRRAAGRCGGAGGLYRAVGISQDVHAAGRRLARRLSSPVRQAAIGLG